MMMISFRDFKQRNPPSHASEGDIDHKYDDRDIGDWTEI